MHQAEVQTPVKVREFVATEMASHFRKSLLLASSPAESSKRRESQNQRIQAYLNSKDSQGRLELLSIIRQKICQTDIILLDLLSRDSQPHLSADQQPACLDPQLFEAGASPQRQERSLQSAPLNNSSDELESIQAQFSTIQQEIALLDQYFSGKLEAIETPLQIQILKNAYEIYQAKQQEIAAKDRQILELNRQLSQSEASHADLLNKERSELASKLLELQQSVEEKQAHIADISKQLREATDKLAVSDRLIQDLQTLNQDLTREKADLEVQKRIDIQKQTTTKKMLENSRKVAEDLKQEIENVKAASQDKQQSLQALVDQLSSDLKHLEEKRTPIATDASEPPSTATTAHIADQLERSNSLLGSDS